MNQADDRYAPGQGPVRDSLPADDKIPRRGFDPAKLEAALARRIAGLSAPARPALGNMAAAALLLAVGLYRFAGDALLDANPAWLSGLDPGWAWLRYSLRTPSDGTLAGRLNVQWFKLLAIPCGVGGYYGLNLLSTWDLRAAERRWRMPAIRATYLGSLVLMVSLMEIEKATHVFGLRMAGLLPGESAALNHLAHAVSAVLGWFLLGRLRYVRPEGPVGGPPGGPGPGPRPR